MTNFLQRIAGSVVRGVEPVRPRLQPMRGSIFEPSGPRAIEALAAPLADFASPMPAQRPAASEPPGVADFAASHIFGERDLLLAPTPVVRGGESRPFVGRSPGMPGHDAALDSTDDLDATRAQPVDEPLPARPARRDRVAQGDAGRTAAEVSPRVDGAVVTTTADRPAMTVAAAAPALARTGRVEPARRARPAAREPDEIHIHIGRIEVAAVVAPPPRPVAQPARTSASLDDYLRRSDGKRR